MAPSLFVNLLTLGFIGLLFAGLLSLLKSTYKYSGWLFVLANTLNFFAGCGFFFNNSASRIVLARFDWLFSFNPTLYFLPAIFLTTISLVSALVGVYSIRYLEVYQQTYNKYFTQFLMSLFVFGMQAVLLANNAFVFLFFWEVMSLSSFFLVLADKSKDSFNAAFLYFIMTHLGASAIMGGFLILGNGSLLFDLSSIKMATSSISPVLASTAFGLFFFGFGSKAGLVPLHVWLPEAHPQAPSNISALMSGLMLKVAIYGFLVVMLNFAHLPSWAGLLVMTLGLLSGLIGALYAAIETDMKKAFAYSSIENMGIVFTILGLAIYLMTRFTNSDMSVYVTPLVVFAVIHSLSHACFKTALFLSSGLVISRVHSRSLEVMGGFAKALPLFSFFFLLAILGALPIPPFGTFFSEWGLLHVVVGLFKSAGSQTGLMSVLVVIISLVGIIGGLATFAMIKVFSISMLGLPRNNHYEIKSEKGDNLLILPIAVLTILVLGIGFFAKPLIAFLVKAFTAGQGTVVVNQFSISSVGLFTVAIGALLFAYIFNKVFASEQGETAYHTWDCGQPINSTMEYTASAFSAPIRFFFLKLVGRNKTLITEPVVATNPWIKKYTFTMSINSAWKNNVYEPIANLFLGAAQKIKLIQSGRIQYYILFLLATLIIALSIGL